MKAAPPLVSFNAGELSPRLEGRIDLAKYVNGCRTLENFLPMVQGGAIKRSGTRYVREVKTSAAATRLIPFEFGALQAYTLEFGNGYIRVGMDGGSVLEPTVAVTGVAATSPIEITTGAAHGYVDGEMVWVAGTAAAGINGSYFNINVTGANTFELLGTSSVGAVGAGGTVARAYEFSSDPVPSTGAYTTAELWTLTFAQSADVLYVACPTKPRRKISRTDHTAWTIEDVADEAPAFSQENLDKNDYMVAGAAAVDGVRAVGIVNLYSTGGHFRSGHIGGFVKLGEVIEGIYPEWTSNGDTAANAYWAAYNIANNVFRNSAENSFAYYEGRLYRFVEDFGSQRSGNAPPLHDDGMQSDGLWLWEYINSGYGWVKITTVTDGYRAVGTVIRELGRTVFVVERDILSISGATPNVVTTTANHEYETGDTVFIRSSLKAGLNNQTWVVTRTGAATFTLDGSAGGGAVGALGLVVRVRTATPTALVTAADRKRHVAATHWAFSAFSAERGYPATVAFFEDRLWWAGTSADPQGLWGSRTGRYEDHLYTDEDDGALFLLLNTQQVNKIEWLSAGKRMGIGTQGGEHVLEGATEGPVTAGNVKAPQHSFYGSRSSVAPLRVESVTLFVQRSGKKLIEYGFEFDSDNYQGQDLTVLAHHVTLGKIKELAWQQEPDRLVWAVLENGKLCALTYDRGQEVVGWHRHILGGADVFVESIAVIPHPDGDADQLWMIVRRTVNGSTKRYVEILERTWEPNTAIEDAFYVDSGATYDGAPTATINGLWHLVGAAVHGIGDGVPVGPFTVSSIGQVTLPAARSVVQLGLIYTANLETMRIEAGSRNGTAQGKTKKVVDVVLRFEDTGTGIQYGYKYDLYPVAAGQLTSGDTKRLTWPKAAGSGGGYEQDARLNIRHSQPLPCTIIAMFPTVDVED